MALIRIGQTVFNPDDVVFAQYHPEKVVFPPGSHSISLASVVIGFRDRKNMIVLAGADAELGKAWLETVPEFTSPPKSSGSVPAQGYQNPGPGYKPSVPTVDYKPSVPTVDVTDPGMAYRPQDDTAGLRYGKGQDTRPEPLL